jgi:predicted aspartyl protease
MKFAIIAAMLLAVTQPVLAAPQPTDGLEMAPRPISRKLDVKGPGHLTQSTKFKVNGFPVTGVIDTGATNLFLNGSTFCKMAQAGMIVDEDVINFGQAQIADGTLVNTIIYKVRVRIGGAVLKSVIASSPAGEPEEICKDTAMNLIGKSVLSRFDSVTFTKSGSVILSDKYEMGEE